MKDEKHESGEKISSDTGIIVELIDDETEDAEEIDETFEEDEELSKPRKKNKKRKKQSKDTTWTNRSIMIGCATAACVFLIPLVSHFIRQQTGDIFSSSNNKTIRTDNTQTEQANDALTIDLVRSVTFSDIPQIQETNTDDIITVVSKEEAERINNLESAQTITDAISYVAFHKILTAKEDGLFHPDDTLTRAEMAKALRHFIFAVSAYKNAKNATEYIEFINEADASQDVIDVDAEAAKDFKDNNTEEYILVKDDPKSGDTEEYILVEYNDLNDTTKNMQWTFDCGIFDPYYPSDSYINRAQMAAILYNFVTFANESDIFTIYQSNDKFEIASSYDTTSSLASLERWPDSTNIPKFARKSFAWATEHKIFDAIAEDCLCPDLPLSREQAAQVITSLLADTIGEPIAKQIAQAAELPVFRSASRDNHGYLQEQIEAVAEKYGAIGVQVGVIENGHVTDTFATGWATKNSDRMTPDHKLRIASISKVAIGMSAMKLRENGLIDLDVPFGTYWDENFRNPYYPDVPVTIRSMLSHTSSIAVADGASLSSSAVRSSMRGSRYSQLVPGNLASWGYNNYAFGILGMTLELAADKTMDKMLHQYFFDTLDIDGGFFPGDLQDTSNLATLYYSGGAVARSTQTQRGFHAGTPGSTGIFFPGGLTMSVRNLAKLDAILASDGKYEGLRLMSEESINLMESHADEMVPDGFYQGLPLRWRNNAYGRENLCYHTGSAYGVYNCLSYDPDTGDGVVVLTTGASPVKNDNGIYAVCGGIFDAVYRVTAD